MLDLHVFPAALGVRHGSPFSYKGEALLRMSGLPYQLVDGNVMKAPKKKLPFMVDRETTVADSHLIQRHLEETHGIDFDGHLNARDHAVGTAFRLMAESQLYFAVLRVRWIDHPTIIRDELFKAVPGPMRGLVAKMVRGKVKKALWGQGMGRHTDAEVQRLAEEVIDAIETQLSDGRVFLLGDRPSSNDAAVAGQLLSASLTTFGDSISCYIAANLAIRAYIERFDAAVMRQESPKLTQVRAA
jgi:glutathione S-transferase